MRYHNKSVQQHLAAQYVAGVMTLRVRLRTEKLQKEIPNLKAAIEDWSNTLSPIPSRIPEIQASSRVWDNIEQSIEQSIGQSNKKLSNQANTREQKSLSPSWWENINFWRTTGIASLASCLCLALAFGLFLSQPEQKLNVAQINSTPNYMAAMSKNGVNNDEITFVINAYKKTEVSPSRLFVQWSKSSPRENTNKFHLWAEDKETGQFTYIGMEVGKGESWDLNKSTWQAVSNSSRLFATSNDSLPSINNTLFSGPCIQLSEWKVL
jgi:anti-sigma-K factor RskA